MPPISLFAEASVAMLSVHRYCQEQSHERSVTAHRPCGRANRSRTSALAPDKHALLSGRASSPQGRTTRILAFHRCETEHHLSPRAMPPNWVARSLRRWLRPRLHQFSAASTLPARVQLLPAQASRHSSEQPDSWLRLPRTYPPDTVDRRPQDRGEGRKV